MLHGKNGDESTIDVLLQSGKELCRQQRYDEAVAAYAEIIRRDASHEEAHIELGKVCLFQEKYDLAESVFLKVVALNDRNTHAHLFLAKTYKFSRKLPQACREFERLMELGYREENIAKELAYVCREIGDYDRAMKYFLAAGNDGYTPEERARELRDIQNGYLRRVRELNYEGKYREVVTEAPKVSRIVLRDDVRLQNSLLNETEIAEKKTKLSSKMRSLTFTLTNRCNLKCLMCQTRLTPWSLPDKVVEEVIRLFPYIERVMWQGGEAFLYERFEELLDEAAKHPLRQVIATNGMLITERLAEKLVKYNVELTFSIDGATKDVYEHIRPGAVFEKVVEKVALINDLRRRINPGMETRLNVLVMRANYRQIEDFVEFARKYEFSTLFFNSAGCDFKNLRENVFYYNHDPEVIGYINRIRDRVTARAREYGIKLENWLPSQEFFGEMHNASHSPAGQRDAGANSPEAGREAGRKLFCHAPWQRLYIDCGGKVRPDCLCPVEKSIGDLSRHSIEELWNGEKIGEYRQRIIEEKTAGFCNNDCVYGRVPDRNLKFI